MNTSNLNNFKIAKGWFVTDLSHPLSCSGQCKSAPLKKMNWHSGDITGETTILVIIPEQELVIALLSNLGSNTKILEILFNIALNFA